MLVGILDEMGRGNTVTVIPVHAELTTQEAADMLNISRPSLIQMLDEGKIEFRKVGTHRRVRFESLMAYKRKVHAERLAALNELAAYDQEIGIDSWRHLGPSSTQMFCIPRGCETSSCTLH